MMKSDKHSMWCQVRTFWVFGCIVGVCIIVYSVQQQAVFSTSRAISKTVSYCRNFCREKFIRDQINEINNTLAFKTTHRVTGKKYDYVSEKGSSSKRNEDKGLKFIYSEAAVTVTANAIHTMARKKVDIGEGPCKQRLPTCIIVGNFKCGTRELIDFMSMHPRVVIKARPNYEIPFFDVKYKNGFEWFRKKMPCSYSNQITMVKTPSYFQHPLVPARIHEMDPTIKLIVLVREPVSRTLSQFTFHNGALKKYRNKLKQAVLLKDEMNSVNEDSYYVKHSIYDEGMERYLKYFNLTQIKVIETEYFKNDPFEVLREVEEFLNIEHTILPENIVFNSQKGFHCLRRNPAIRTAACYQSNRGRNSSKVANMIKDVGDVLDKLKEFYKPHNERFYELVGRTFEWGDSYE